MLILAASSHIGFRRLSRCSQLEPWTECPGYSPPTNLAPKGYGQRGRARISLSDYLCKGNREGRTEKGVGGLFAAKLIL